MPKSKQKNPIQLRPKNDIEQKLRKIAEVNGLSVSDVANLCLASGLTMVEQKLREMTTAKAA